MDVILAHDALKNLDLERLAGLADQLAGLEGNIPAIPGQKIIFKIQQVKDSPPELIKLSSEGVIMSIDKINHPRHQW